MKTSFSLNVSVKNLRAPGIMNGGVDEFSFEVSGESEYSLEELKEVSSMIFEIIKPIASALAGLGAEPKSVPESGPEDETHAEYLLRTGKV